MIASPHGYRFLDADALAAQTGHPVRHQYKEPDAPDVLPPADAMIVALTIQEAITKLTTWGVRVGGFNRS